MVNALALCWSDWGSIPDRIKNLNTCSVSIFCSTCSCWVHKKCSNVNGPLIKVVNFTCARCSGLARAIDARPNETVTLSGEDVEVVDSFRYLDDMISAGGGCRDATTARICSA